VNPEYARIRDYLKAQGAKLPPTATVDKVRAAMAQLRASAAAVPAARFTERPAPEEWSGNEVMPAPSRRRLDVTIEHPMFGPLNWRQTLLFMRLHDLDHAGQLDKIAAALAAARTA
jgi:hypothetical protein